MKQWRITVARALPWLVSLGCLLASVRASAQVELGAFGRAIARVAAAASSTTALPSVFARSRAGRVPVIVRSKSSVISAPELTSLGGFAFAALDPARIPGLAAAHPDWSF